MSTVPLLFQVATPFKLGVPTSVVVPVVFKVPLLMVTAPRLKVSLTVIVPAPAKVPPVSVNVEVFGTNMPLTPTFSAPPLTTRLS